MFGSCSRLVRSCRLRVFVRSWERGVEDDDGGRCAGEEEEDGLVLMILLSSHKG